MLRSFAVSLGFAFASLSVACGGELADDAPNAVSRTDAVRGCKPFTASVAAGNRSFEEQKVCTDTNDNFYVFATTEKTDAATLSFRFETRGFSEPEKKVMDERIADFTDCGVDRATIRLSAEVLRMPNLSSPAGLEAQKQRFRAHLLSLPDLDNDCKVVPSVAGPGF